MRVLTSAVLVCLGLAVLSGCDKEYKLTFVNDTPDHREVEITLPGEGPQYVGFIDGEGSKTRAWFELDTRDLPCTVKWKAGDLDGAIPLDKHTHRKLWIHVNPKPIPPADEKTEVRIQHSRCVKKTVHKETVVK